jgi:hypothetical protein
MVRLAGMTLVALLASIAAGCSLDPVNDEARADLGPETPGVARGPLHRPGQPCLACHDGSTAHPAMTVAGTVNAVLGSAAPLAGVSVALTDVTGMTVTAMTNAAGNFYLEPATWRPTFPLHVAISFGGYSSTMSTIIGRDGSCATCHTDPASRISAGPVFLAPVPALLPDGGAP